MILLRPRQLSTWNCMVETSRGVPRERDFLGKCVARASSFDHPQCQEPKHIHFILKRKKRNKEKRTNRKKKQKKTKKKRQTEKHKKNEK